MKKIILSILFLLMASQGAWATYPSYTVCPSGCDFNTLYGAVNDLETNHATPASPVTITISGSWSSTDSTSVNITGVTTSATNNITITTTGSARHNGQWTSTGYVMYQADYGSGGLSINNDYVVIDGIQFYEYNDFGYSDAGYIINGGGNYHITIKNCIIKSNRAGSNGNPIVKLNDDIYLVMYNCLFYEVGNKVANAFISAGYDATGSFTLYNNTFYGFNIGIANGANNIPFTLYNNLCNNNTTDYYSEYGAFPVYASSNNISQDTSSPDSAYRSKTVSFVNAGSYNFNLALSDTAATGQGANESSVFTTDITGATRTVPWDIGAFKATAIIVTPHSTELISNGKLYSKGNLYVQ